MEQETKREKARRLFAQSQKLFRCPVCGKRIRMTPGGSFLCQKKHSFDLSQKGYLNLAGAGTLPGYGKGLFENRRQVFSDGFYNPLADSILQMIQKYKPDGTCHILDAGCGEGFYTARLSGNPALGECRFFGVDLSRDAVALAARQEASACWCVADLAKLPFREDTMDVVLDILTPANYREFSRVLHKGGIVIKVIPGSDYLREIREAAAPQIQKKAYSDQDVADYTKAHMEILEKLPVRACHDVTPEQALRFFGMTPMTTHVENCQALAEQVKTVTLDLTVLVGRFR